MVILLVMRIICDAAVVASAGGHVPDDEASVMTATMTTMKAVVIICFLLIVATVDNMTCSFGTCWFDRGAKHESLGDHELHDNGHPVNPYKPSPRDAKTPKPLKPSNP